MSLVPIRRVVHGESIPLPTRDSSPGEMPLERVETRNPSTPIPPRAEGHPASFAEAVANGLVELWSGPNVPGYALLVDTASSRVCLFGYPVDDPGTDPGRVTTGADSAFSRLKPIGGSNASWNQANRQRHPHGGGPGPYKPAA